MCHKQFQKEKEKIINNFSYIFNNIDKVIYTLNAHNFIEAKDIKVSLEKKNYLKLLNKVSLEKKIILNY